MCVCSCVYLSVCVVVDSCLYVSACLYAYLCVCICVCARVLRELICVCANSFFKFYFNVYNDCIINHYSSKLEMFPPTKRFYILLNGSEWTSAASMEHFERTSNISKLFHHVVYVWHTDQTFTIVPCIISDQKYIRHNNSVPQRRPCNRVALIPKSFILNKHEVKI